MRLSNAVLYGLVAAAVIYGIFLAQRPPTIGERAAERSLDELPEIISPLPPPSPLDERIIVEAAAPQDGLGSAFAISPEGYWLTARHVVDGCAVVRLRAGTGAVLDVLEVTLDETSDLALLTTGMNPDAVRLDLSSPLILGAPGYFVGFPQGEPGEVSTRLFANARLITIGERESDEPVLTWVETERSDGLDGTLSGLSGGPVFDAEGEVRAVIVAESPRRGRIYTATPETVNAFLTRLNVPVEAGRSETFDEDTFRKRSAAARRRLQVVRVECEVTP